MTIPIRPHHFLCLQGYRGQNYSRQQSVFWIAMSAHLKQNPEADMLIVTGKDELCKLCPAALLNKNSYCKEKEVNILDKKIQEILGIVSGHVYKYSEIIDNLNKKMTPEIHKNLCEMCAWWKKGLCRTTFDKNLSAK